MKSVKSMTKEEMAKYSSSVFNVTINRKKSREEVVKQFKSAERDFVKDQKRREEKKKATFENRNLITNLHIL